ncbi:MAG TPA: Fe-S cluster assembly protein SufD [Devosia sp.]|jgi:Fe-S cluster assembly protein SufD|nr:Fe-S cluster assembly protein SufD [Devosia sp.]
MPVPVRIGPAEQKLIDQLSAAGASAAAERLGAVGLPTRKVESYHYTDLKMLLRAVPELAGAGHALSEPALRIPGAHRVPMTNGVADIAGEMPPGMRAAIVHGAALTERDDVLVRLNSALAKQTLKLEIHSRATQVVHIDRRTEAEGPAHMNDSVHLFVADGSKATVIETFSGTDEAHLSNHASYVAVGKGAELTHILLDLSSGQSTNLATAEYQVGENARIRTLTIHVGSALSRINLFARFVGEGATGDFTGLNLTTEGQHSDVTLELTHAVPRCAAKPLFKQVARGRSTAAFQGKIVVARDAQKTDAKLMMQGLMLSDEAQILSKPELEIFADDVVCGHGSTVGALDEDSMFYLMSRGIPRPVAESMLTRGFLEEVLDPIEDEELHSALEAVVENWLEGNP